MPPHIADLTDIVRTVLRNDDIELVVDSRFDELPDWDSMHLIAVVVEAECRFGLLFEPVEIEALYTAADLLRAVTARQGLTVGQAVAPA